MTYVLYRITNFINKGIKKVSQAKIIECNYQDNYYGDQLCSFKQSK